MYSEHASRAVPGAVVWHSVRTTDDSVLPDGCMDLVWRSGDVVVAGPDTQPFAVPGSAVPSVGLRLRPGSFPTCSACPPHTYVIDGCCWPTSSGAAPPPDSSDWSLTMRRRCSRRSSGQSSRRSDPRNRS
ncbi:hypothetical protein P9209_05775 [Prescottella defluvii]|nr:hypothetical protein P9209_05775 [Prescottella defluvii]